MYYSLQSSIPVQLGTRRNKVDKFTIVSPKTDTTCIEIFCIILKFNLNERNKCSWTQHSDDLLFY